MKTYKIYTAGPISGLTYEESALGWRQEIRGMMPPEFELFSPMRAKDFLATEGILQGSYEETPMSSTAGILGRDRNDVSTCDLMLANFLEDQGNMSLGTAMEFGWADAWRKPIIMICSGVCGRHVIIRNCVQWILGAVSTDSKVIAGLHANIELDLCFATSVGNRGRGWEAS